MHIVITIWIVLGALGDVIQNKVGCANIEAKAFASSNSKSHALQSTQLSNYGWLLLQTKLILCNPHN